MADTNVKLYIKEGSERTPIAPSTAAAFVSVNDESGSPSNVDVEITKLRNNLANILAAGIGISGKVSSSSPLPTTDYKKGQAYIVAEAGTYVGQECEIGDLIICVNDFVTAASNDDWVVLQANLVNAVSGPQAAVANNVPIFDGTTGKLLKDSGFTIEKSVPVDAKFTDTTYTTATTSADGLMSKTDKEALDNLSTATYIEVVDSLDAVSANLVDGGLIVLKGSN